MEDDDRREAVRALRRGIELGLTHIDTAEMYGSGRVEELVAEAIAGQRDRVFLASKVLPSNASYRGTLQACERSLARLKTDHLDLYMIHWPGSHPMNDTVRAFETLVEQGKIARWGVSNFDAGELEEVLGIAGESKIACNQVLYHPLERSIEHAVLPWCQQHGVPLVAYSPYGSGNFPRGRGGAALAAVAERHAASARQVALAFVVRREGVYTIPKASKLAHVEDNAGALAVKLTADDIAELEAAMPLGAPRKGLAFL
jgi:diketogulonate reductase-like aldo/keto reductase